MKLAARLGIFWLCVVLTLVPLWAVIILLVNSGHDVNIVVALIAATVIAVCVGALWSRVLRGNS